ncbi:ArsR/SmtB family transcription factor [Subtercola sp. YIM 133946]|uniref:ArsR/SmtB family transcription factor n=1 Tax=Subtercola sp. YIM 133946 TaxID=3118909 RepID=UPI002F9482BC
MPDNPYPQPQTADIRLTDVLRALADPGRVKMVQVLSDGAFHRCTVDDFGLDITKSTLSHHFKTLREAGLTTVKIDGRNHSIALRSDDVESRFPGLLASLTSAEAIDDVAATG